MIAALMGREDRSPISLTGRFTGQVWVRNQLSPKGLDTTAGRWLYRMLIPLDLACDWLQGVSLETMLLHRHKGIDRLTAELVQRHPDIQILEIACGLSARAWRLFQGHILPPSVLKDVRYIETDLPDVVEHKAHLYRGMGFTEAHHQIRGCNILRSDGPLSPESIIADLDPARPLLVITEGLVNYFPLTIMQAFWQRLARAFVRFPHGYYLADIWPRLPEYHGFPLRSLALKGYEVITHQPAPLHFEDDADIQRGFAEVGFAHTEVFDPDHWPTGESARSMRRRTLFRLIRAQLVGE